ncbi:MAG TPA: HIT domain-containing protein [Pyrodictiaceae archaeon]|nr:HIT domain-containing protein [Pyrodictiaceae archaeon]
MCWLDVIWAPWRSKYIREVSSVKKQDREQRCIFCEAVKKDDNEALILYRGKSCYVMMNLYPYNTGHIMIIPYKHVPSIEYLSSSELLEMMQLVKISIKIIKQALNPDRFNINRRTYIHARSARLAIALASLIAYGAQVEESIVQGENTIRLRLTLDLPSKPQVRILLIASMGSITLGEVERIESQIATAVLSKWHPHAVIIVYYGTIEVDARRKLDEIEKKYFTKLVTIAIPTMVARTQLLALGLKILEASGTMEEAASNAIRLVGDQELAEKLGFFFV